MGTVVSVTARGAADEQLDACFAWFHRVEAACSRFRPDSEVVRLAGAGGRTLPVSPLLFQVLRFALEVAEASGGSFDPTLGRRLEAAGYDREYTTGERFRAPGEVDPAASYRDIQLDAAGPSVRLVRPLLLDLSAVAKGLAIDLAAAELAALDGYCVEAGGDLRVGGRGPEGDWRIGIRHPFEPGSLAAVLHLTDAAVCTSAESERGPHLIGAIRTPIAGPPPRSGLPELASLTVVAPTAMAADALSTAAYVMGGAGLSWLEGQGVEGLAIDSDLGRSMTGGFERWLR